MTPERKPRLSEEGQIYVTLAAAEQYLRALRSTDPTSHAHAINAVESARRELTLRMLDAYRTEGDASRVRLRDRKTGLDLTANTETEGRLIIIRSCNVRDLNVTR